MLGLDYLEELKESAKLPVDYEKIIESDDLLLNLDIIKLRVFKVTMFALAHEKPFMKEVIDAMEESRSSGNLLSYYTERLPSKDLFECLRLLDSDCLWIVLERLKTYHINLIENLIDAVLNNNYEGYKTVLNENEINTEPITPISKILYAKIRIDKSLVNCFEEIQNLESMDDEEVPEKYRNQLLRSISETKSIMGEIKNSKDSNDVYESVERIIVDSDFVERVKNETAPFKERYMGFVIKNLKRDFPSIKEKGLTYEEYLNYVYMGLLQDYCEGIAGFPSLSTYAKLVIENILKSELFKTAWNGYDKFNENTYYDLDARMDEFCERFGLVEEEDEESRLMMGSNEGHIIDSTKKRQLGGSDSEIQGFKDSKPDLKKKTNNTKRWRLQNYLNREVGLDEKTKLPYCKGFKKSIAEAGSAGDRALAKFIQGIADWGYIDDDRVTKKSFAYALTGRGGFREMVIKKVTWHHKKEDTREIPESVRVLLFISSNLFDPELTRGKTYSQIFEVLDAETNPCIKDGKDQSASYYDSVSDAFKSFYDGCFKNVLNKKNAAK